MAAPLRALPPGVYFHPTPEECVRDFLKPWAAGFPPAMDRVICGLDVYSAGPDELLRGREPGFSRGGVDNWLLLSHCRRRGKRGMRGVGELGSWKVEQKPKGVAGDGEGEDDDEQPRGGSRRTYGFHVWVKGTEETTGKKKKKRSRKTQWLMEEFTADEDGDGAGDDGGETFPVFCRIYVTPRMNEDKQNRLILGEEDMVDRHGETNLLRVAVSPELFDAVAAQGQGLPPPPRVLRFQQAPPVPPLRVLGHQQAQPRPLPVQRFLGQQHGTPAAALAALRFLREQYRQAAATAAVRVLGHHRGYAVLPRAVPARHHGHGAAAPHRRFLGYQQGQDFRDPHYNNRQVAALHRQRPSPPAIRLDPQQGEAMSHMEKKPRLASPQPQGQLHDVGDQCCGADADAKAFQDAEPVATVPPPPPHQEVPGTTTAGSTEHQCEVSAPASAEHADDTGKAGAEPVPDPGIFEDLPDLELEPFEITRGTAFRCPPVSCL